MVGEIDEKDKNETRKIAIAIVSLVVVLGLAIFLMAPIVAELVCVHFAPGLGFRDSAVISFFVTIVIMIIFAISAGDGLLGEIQFILGGFFLFFVIIWLLVAWVF